MEINKKTIAKKGGKNYPLRKSQKQHKTFPIVAIGASAGGLEAVTTLLQNLPVNAGMACIYVQHLSPAYPSSLVLLLSRTTKMKVQEIEDMERMEPDNVYVIPYNKGIEVTDGHIKLIPHSKTSAAISIDVLFSSLAQTHKGNIIGVVLSGNASDGSQGIKAIKQAGGVTFAQDESAKFNSMPQSAIATGAIDFVLPPKEIASEIARLIKNGFVHNIKYKKKADEMETSHPDLKTIFGILYKRTSVDFSHYKINTIKRRIQRRMLLHKKKTIKEYIKLVMNNSKEADLLYQDFFIPVTNFFRDKETFGYLKTTLFPKLLHGKSEDEPLRIWVPACSTGEEAYSMAMLLTELQDNKTVRIPVQIFATDLSAHAIQKARVGDYSKENLKPIGQKLTERFFTKINGNYRISKPLREMCVFAQHNILRDPPFSRMDFVSCRNLLIYFDAAAQKKALSTIHFALKDKGYLLLGKAETIGTALPLFTSVNNKHKIYLRKRNTGAGRFAELTPRFQQSILPGMKPLPEIKKEAVKFPVTDSVRLEKAIDNALFSRYMPASVIINSDMEILQFRGPAELFLKPSPGKASLNILKMTRPEFAFELRNIILKAFKTKQPASKSGIEIKLNSHFQTVSIEACPLQIQWDEPLLMVVFTAQEQIEKYIKTANSQKSNSAQKDKRITKLTEELNMARVGMHTVIESHETANEELQAANEEIVSSNEELQTLNEELETSKEEIEATNEELTSTNQEMHTRNELLTESYNYSEIILANIHEPIVILDNALKIKSANKSFYKKFRLREEETEGKFLFELDNGQWNIPKLHTLLENILSKNPTFSNFEITHTFPEIGEKIILLNASRIIQKTHGEQLILLAIEDVTQRTHRHQEEKEVLHKDKIALEKAVRLRANELEKKNKELERMNKELETFTFVSSHDLQEPLRKIKNFVSVLLTEEKEKLSSDGKKYLQKTSETAIQMQQLIEDLLAYSRTKNTERNFKKTDLTVIADKVKNDFLEVIKERKARIEYTHLHKADIIPLQFYQLLQNLISNSLKFSKPGKPPHIIIKSKIEHGSKINHESLSPKTRYCHVIYTDNGIGFESKYNERIFEVFQRLHGKEVYQGTGMGLAICKRIVENHRGIITATGTVNKGARFDIYIPVQYKN